MEAPASQVGSALGYGPELGDVEGQGTWLLGTGVTWIPAADEDRDQRRQYTIIVLLFSAFIGAQIAARFLHRHPSDQSARHGPRLRAPIGPLAPRLEQLQSGRPSCPSAPTARFGHNEGIHLLYGARISFEDAVLAAIGSISIGVLLRTMSPATSAGWVDAVRLGHVTESRWRSRHCSLSWRLASTVRDSIDDVTFRGIISPGVSTLFIMLAPVRLVSPRRVVRIILATTRRDEKKSSSRSKPHG